MTVLCAALKQYLNVGALLCTGLGTCFWTAHAQARPRKELKTELESEMGVTTQTNLENNFKKSQVQNIRPYLTQKISREVFNSWGTGKVVAAYRARADVKTDFANGTNKEITLRTLTFDWAADFSQLRLGLQDVSWGEFFGFNVIDVVNPRDLTEPLFSEDSDAKIPVTMLSQQFFWDSWNFQGIYTPTPSRSPLPNTFKNVPIRKAQKYKAVRDAEYGFKSGYLFNFGFDANVFVFEHWNRVPAFRLIPIPTGVELQSRERRVQSYGGSFSQAFDAIVLRGDYAIHNNIPIASSNAQKVFFYQQQQSIVGFDFTSAEQTTLGLQYFFERYDRPVDSYRSTFYQLAGTRLQFKMFNDLFENQVIVFSGIQKSDLWINPQVTWNISSGWRAVVAAHYVNTPADGYLKRAELRNTLQSRLVFRF